MKEQLTLLKQIQQIDLETDAIHNKINSRREKLEEYRGVFEHLTADLKQQQLGLEETRLLRREKEVDLQAFQERHKKAKLKLQSVTTMKEQTAAEQEVETIKRSITQIEGEYLELDEAIQNTEASIEEKNKKVDDLSSVIRESEVEVEQEMESSNDKLKSVTSRRSSIESDIKPHIVRQYEFIRSRRDGEAVVPAKNGYCTGCYMALPPQLFNEIQRGETLTVCPSCRRILYYEQNGE